jgi:hypothetical protein
MAIILVTDYPGMKTALLTWIRAYADVGTAIFINQEADRPAKPYATLQIIADNIKTGDDDVRQEFDGGGPTLKHRVVGMREMTAQLTVYTEPAESVSDVEAADKLNTLLISLDHPEVVSVLNSANVTVLRHTPVIRLDEQLGQRWERRAASDLRLMYTAESVDDGSFGEWVETVQIPTTENGNLTVNT